MRPKKLISALLAILVLAACGASYAAGARTLLKRRMPAPSPVVIVSYRPSGEQATGLHYALEGSLLSIKSFLASAGQPSGNKPPVPTQGAKGLPAPAQVHPLPPGPIP